MTQEEKTETTTTESKRRKNANGMKLKFVASLIGARLCSLDAT